MALEKPLGRMTRRPNAAGDGQRPRIKLWTLETKPGTIAERLQQFYLRSLEAIEKYDGKKAELARDDRFTDVGRQKQALEFAFGNLLPDFQKGRRALQQAQQELDVRRSKLQSPQTDKTDTVGAFRRARMCDRMAKMTESERQKFAMDRRTDPNFQLAMIEAHTDGEDTGLSNVLLDEIIQDTMQRTNGPLLEEIRELEKAIEIAASALEDGREAIRAEAIAADPIFADRDVFNARVAEAAALAEPAWIKPHVEDGQEVLRVFDWNEQANTGVFRKATDEDLANGIIAASKEEFEKLKSQPAPVFEDRKARADYVNEHGVEAYLSRHAVA